MALLAACVAAESTATEFSCVSMVRAGRPASVLALFVLARIAAMSASVCVEAAAAGVVIVMVATGTVVSAKAATSKGAISFRDMGGSLTKKGVY